MLLTYCKAPRAVYDWICGKKFIIIIIRKAAKIICEFFVTGIVVQVSPRLTEVPKLKLYTLPSCWRCSGLTKRGTAIDRYLIFNAQSAAEVCPGQRLRSLMSC